jgi:septum formation protein
MSLPKPPLILASASPRRHELLRRLGVPFTVMPSDLSEELPPGPFEDAVKALALAKARAVARQVATGVVLGADTVVALGGTVFGKPVDRDDGRRMLRALRGKRHEVLTGVAVVEAPAGREASAAVVTHVHMAEFGDDEIDAYLATPEPYDKAGAYAVQGGGSRMVARVDGCYTNVVGLPLTTTRRLLAEWGFTIGEEPLARGCATRA